MMRGRSEVTQTNHLVVHGIVSLLDYLDITRAHSVGYSIGARVTSWLIVDRRERLITATLGGSTYYVDTPEQRRFVHREVQ